MAVDVNEPGQGCPHMQLAPCGKRACRLYIEMVGVNPNTGKDVAGWDCTYNWQTLLMLENTRATNGTGAAVESLRNVVAGPPAPTGVAVHVLPNASSGAPQLQGPGGKA